LQIAEPFLLRPDAVRRGGTETVESRPWVIEPWPVAPPDIVVYEFGARLDAGSQVAADVQIQRARQLYNDLIGCIRIVHTEMNAWVLDRAGSQARALQGQLLQCEAEIASAKRAGEVERFHQLAPQRLQLGSALTALLRPVREQHRTTLRTEFFARVGKTHGTQTYALRCQAVAAGLGWATANEVLDSALLAWKRSLAQARVPRFASGDRKDQDSLILQFTAKGGLPVQQVLDGSSREIHLVAPDIARRRAYGGFRFRLGLAQAATDATGTWQYHRPIPERAHVTSARLVRRRVADRFGWSIELVLRLAEPLHVQHTPKVPLGAIHFGWTKCEGGRLVATVAQGAEPAAVKSVVLPSSIEDDLAKAAVLQKQRAQARDGLLPRLAALARAKRELPTPLRAELVALAAVPRNQLAAARLYRLHAALAQVGLRRDWFDTWIRDDRMHWQAAVLLARHARGRRRDFYRCKALEIARHHGAVVLESLDLRAASKAVDETSGHWAGFSRHARAGRVVVALNEFEQALRWACVRHDTPVFELKGMTARTCAVCGTSGLTVPPALTQEARRQVLCSHCGAQHDRQANAACSAWRKTSEGLDLRINSHRNRCAGLVEQTKARVEARKMGIAAKRKAGRAAEAMTRRGGDAEGPG
jgi:hypothetical protein